MSSFELNTTYRKRTQNQLNLCKLDFKLPCIALRLRGLSHVKSENFKLGLGIESSPRHLLYVYRYEAYAASLILILMIFSPISIMRHASELSYNLLGHEKQL